MSHITTSDTMVGLVRIVGLQYSKSLKLLQSWKPGDVVQLKACPVAEDRYAVAVYWKGKRVAWIDRAHSQEVFLRLTDQSYAQIAAVNRNASLYDAVQASVYGLMPPFSARAQAEARLPYTAAGRSNRLFVGETEEAVDDLVLAYAAEVTKARRAKDKGAKKAEAKLLGKTKGVSLLDLGSRIVNGYIKGSVARPKTPVKFVR